MRKINLHEHFVVSQSVLHATVPGAAVAKPGRSSPANQPAWGFRELVAYSILLRLAFSTAALRLPAVPNSARLNPSQDNHIADPTKAWNGSTAFTGGKNLGCLHTLPLKAATALRLKVVWWRVPWVARRLATQGCGSESRWDSKCGMSTTSPLPFNADAR